MSGVKRKRESSVADIRINSVNKDLPVVVGSFFNGVSVPKSTEFSLYAHKKSKDYIFHGENETLDYNGDAPDDDGSDYVVALYDPVNKNVDLYKTQVMEGKITSRAKRAFKGPKVKQAGIRNVVQRNALGEAFGTKKAKAAITNLEKNRIDADRLQDAEMDIIDSVKQSTQALPTREEIDTASQTERPTPPANEGATNVEDIYPVHSIIPKKDWNSIRVDSMFDEANEQQLLEYMPYGKSFYVSKKLPSIVASKNTENLKLLYYAALLFGVYENRRVREKQTLLEKLDNKPSELLVDGIVERFTISRTSQFGKSKDRSFIIDPSHEDKLLCYLLTIILHLDNFLIELAPLAHELNMKPSKLVTLCRALGATVKSATVAQAEAFGIAKISASTYKLASLKVPFRLPEITRKGRRGGR